MDVPTVIGVASDGLLYHVISDASFKVPSGQRAGASGELGWSNIGEARLSEIQNQNSDGETEGTLNIKKYIHSKIGMNCYS